tara:strand:+ start:19 stop:972 length:954 start_codon:yes stop_codon:yes gene_type:complete
MSESENKLYLYLSKAKSKYGKPYSSNTIKTYTNAIMQFTKGDLSKMNNIDVFKEYLKTKSTSSKINNTRCIMSCLKIVNNDPELLKEYKKILEELIENREAGKEIIPNIRNKTKSTFNDWSKVESRYRQILRKIRKQKLKRKQVWSNEDRHDYMVYVIASLYYLIPPRRNVYATLQVLKTDEAILPNTNYLIVGAKARSPMYFILADYKTSGKYGTKKIQVDKTLELVLRPWIRKIRPGIVHPKPFLYNLRDNTQMTKHNLTNFITRNVFPGISTQKLRRLFDSQKHIVDAKAILVDNAEKMNHSVNVAISTYIPDK